jgi:hypothetical protein
MVWLFLLLGVQQVPGALPMTPVVSVLAGTGALAMLLSPRVRRGDWYFLALWLALLPALKYALGYSIAGAALPTTLFACAAVAITILLARWVASVFDELRTAVFCNLVKGLKSRAQAFGSGQGELYREVRRARLFERPLAFLAVSAAPETVESAQDRFTQEVMNCMLEQYVTARIANLLSRRLNDCDVIAQRNGHFIAALPETDRDAALAVSRRLQVEARQELGIELRFGLCTCPDEEATFIGLLDRAEENLRRAGDIAPTEDYDLAKGDRDQAATLVTLNGADALAEAGHSLLASSHTAR